MRDTNNDTLFDTAQAAAYLGYSKSCLEWWRMVKRGPAFHKLGEGRVRYKKSDLDAFVESGRVEPRRA
ncbi:MAG: helix-turn-helix domain-containing protein [Tabrizicola sp.]|jgi:predicted DNA-binding transcriptional regulator AlpA|nr:helix-turn-helix domain-containing protein [Tabrizicola sp.]